MRGSSTSVMKPLASYSRRRGLFFGQEAHPRLSSDKNRDSIVEVYVLTPRNQGISSEHRRVLIQGSVCPIWPVGLAGGVLGQEHEPPGLEHPIDFSNRPTESRRLCDRTQNEHDPDRVDRSVLDRNQALVHSPVLHVVGTRRQM